MSKHYLLSGLMAGFACLQLQAQSVDVMADTWVSGDGLNRVVASADCGVTRQEVDTAAQVGIFYYIWHGQHGDETKDITRILEADPDNPQWGPIGQFHWSSKPALGYYAAGDRFVVAKHMQMLMDAGIDFYFFDVTNAFTYDAQVQVVMDEIDRRAKLGLKTPKLVFCTHSSSAVTTYYLYNKWYADSEYDKYWFYWEGKPLVLINADEDYIFRKYIDEAGFALEDKFTLRYCWAWQQGENCWPWLAYYPQEMNYTKDAEGGMVPEQMSVSAAQHPYSKIGKSYNEGRQPVVDAYGLNVTTTPRGLYLQEQFDQAITRHPRVLMVTQWNEWMAQRFIVGEGQEDLTRPGAKENKVGETYFVDVYNQEFSRDIEPSADPLIRDNYYLLMVSNLRKYRGARPIPVPTECRTIDLVGGFGQWADVQPEFLDEPGDVQYTSTKAMDAKCRKRKSNDIVACKVAKDSEHLYFYARVNTSTVHKRYAANSKETWMNVLINSDMQYDNGWEGYDYMIAGSPDQCHLYRYDADTLAWVEGAEVQTVIDGPEMMYAVRRADVDLTADTDFDFKWVDNTPAFTTDILDFIPNGDCAPTGRFNYRYKGSAVTTPDGIPVPRADGHPTSTAYNLSGQPGDPHLPGIYIQNGRKGLVR